MGKVRDCPVGQMPLTHCYCWDFVDFLHLLYALRIIKGTLIFFFNCFTWERFQCHWGKGPWSSSCHPLESFKERYVRWQDYTGSTQKNRPPASWIHLQVNRTQWLNCKMLFRFISSYSFYLICFVRSLEKLLEWNPADLKVFILSLLNVKDVWILACVWVWPFLSPNSLAL